MPRRLALFFDGTWNDPGDRDVGASAPTNVWRLFTALAGSHAPWCFPAGVRRSDGEMHLAVGDAGDQLAWYHDGVGTRGFWDRLLGGAGGVGLGDNVVDGYAWLALTWRPGDEIHLYGFSRGAYTARSLAGMIRKCGLPAAAAGADPGLWMRAYGVYRDGTHPEDVVARRFRRDLQAGAEDPPPIAVVGVWDTVGCLGIPLRLAERWNLRRYQFHDTHLSRWVLNAYHALAVDEQRPQYAPALWADDCTTRTPPRPDLTLHVEQRWFAGVHCNVGGGYRDQRLADLPLAWLAGKAAGHGLHLTWPRPPPDACRGDLRDSFHEFLGPWGNWGYALFNRRIPRSIRPGLAAQAVDASVRERQGARLGYAPINLPAPD